MDLRMDEMVWDIDGGLWGGDFVHMDGHVRFVCYDDGNNTCFFPMTRLTGFTYGCTAPPNPAGCGPYWCRRSFSDAEGSEDPIEHILRRRLAGNLAKGLQGVAEIDAEKLWGGGEVGKQASEGIGGAAEAVLLMGAIQDAVGIGTVDSPGE